MRVLMLGGARDEVVPRSQMEELWAIIRSRGRARDDEKPASSTASSTKAAVSTGEKAKAAARGKAADEGDDDAKVPPRVLTDGGNTYIEFSAGTHSACLFFLSSRLLKCGSFAFADDTCVQPGYWSAVNEFVASLSSGTATSGTPSS